MSKDGDFSFSSTTVLPSIRSWVRFLFLSANKNVSSFSLETLRYVKARRSLTFAREKKGFFKENILNELRAMFLGSTFGFSFLKRRYLKGKNNYFRLSFFSFSNIQQVVPVRRGRFVRFLTHAASSRSEILVTFLV